MVVWHPFHFLPTGLSQIVVQFKYSSFCFWGICRFPFVLNVVQSKFASCLAWHQVEKQKFKLPVWSCDIILSPLVIVRYTPSENTDAVFHCQTLHVAIILVYIWCRKYNKISSPHEFNLKYCILLKYIHSTVWCLFPLHSLGWRYTFWVSVDHLFRMFCCGLCVQ